jgi:hypothetical protein
MDGDGSVLRRYTVEGGSSLRRALGQRCWWLVGGCSSGMRGGASSMAKAELSGSECSIESRGEEAKENFTSALGSYSG